MGHDHRELIESAQYSRPPLDPLTLLMKEPCDAARQQTLSLTWNTQVFLRAVQHSRWVTMPRFQ